MPGTLTRGDRSDGSTASEAAWIQAGFFWISDGRAPLRESSLLPTRLVTVSTCIVDSYPDSWALPWFTTPPEKLLEIRASLALDDRDFAALLAWVARAIDTGDFGWPNVFSSLRVSREFHALFLRAPERLRLVGLTAAKDVAEEFLIQEVPEREGAGSGVWTALSRNAPLAPGGTTLGFDVLGANYGGDFHTFSCNDLARDYHEKLGICFNRHGLIDDERQAIDACEYTNRDEVGAAPVAWYPFRVDQYDFDESAITQARSGT